MAWRSSGSSNAALIANLAANGLIKSDRVKQAMTNVGDPAICESWEFNVSKLP